MIGVKVRINKADDMQRRGKRKMVSLSTVTLFDGSFMHASTVCNVLLSIFYAAGCHRNNLVGDRIGDLAVM